MNALDNIPVDLFNLLIFTMPGFFFVRPFIHKPKTDFEYLMLSMFWGILLMILFYKIIPAINFTPLFENAYAGAVVFSILGYLLYFIIRFIKYFFRKITGGTW